MLSRSQRQSRNGKGNFLSRQYKNCARRAASAAVFAATAFLLGSSSLLCLAPRAEAADQGQIKSAQRKLQQQGFFYGEVDGRLDEETTAAIKRFQIRQGIEVTGELDAATQSALTGASASEQDQPPDGETAPDAAPSPARQITSAQERARTVAEDDRAFLRKEEASDRMPVRPAVPAASPPSRPPPPPPVPAVERPRPDAVEKEPPPRSRPAIAPRPRRITEEEAARFVQSYLRAAERPTPESEVSFYADTVDYFNSGRVSRAFVARDQQRYYKRWPVREFTLLEPPEVLESDEDDARVAFRIRYRVESGRESAEGRTENIMRLKRVGADLKIASMRERKIRD